jgi:type VI secretion system secreted protein VgrG
VEKVLHTGKFAHTDYNFEKPGTSLMSPESEQRSYTKADYEIYDFPGEYPEKADGEQYAKVRMEELALSYESCAGESDARGICPGYLFTLEIRDNQDLALGDPARAYLGGPPKNRAAAEDYETSGGGMNYTVVHST